jgi:hypothetical protein
MSNEPKSVYARLPGVSLRADPPSPAWDTDDTYVVSSASKHGETVNGDAPICAQKHVNPIWPASISRSLKIGMGSQITSLGQRTLV